MKQNDKIKKLINQTPPEWKEEARFLLDKPWLTTYSSEIARRVIAIVKDELDDNQAELARLAGVQRQQISKILKGQENMTLETIYKLSKALNFELLSFPPYKYSEKKISTAGKVVKASDYNTKNSYTKSQETKDEVKKIAIQESSLSKWG